MSKRTWVLGASDPEMVKIETILSEAREAVVYATIDGTRVYPGNAYRADWPEVDGHLLLVECGFASPSDEALSNIGEIIHIDHHREGDPGFACPPEEFLPASSLGQVLEFLARNGLVPGRCGTLLDYGELSARPFFYAGEWQQDVCWSGGSWYRRIIPQELVLTAAADHCLESAYRGFCPGVDPDALMAWRVKTRAAFQGRHESEVLADVERARELLREAVLEWIHPSHIEGWCENQGRAPTRDEAAIIASGKPGRLRMRAWADLRKAGYIPELPEAAAREGIPVLAETTDRDGRRKVVMQAASTRLVVAFLDGRIVEGLRGVYGDPARGFAGGYLD